MAGSGMDRDHLRGILFLHIPGLSITDPGASALPGIPPHCGFVGWFSGAWFSWALFESRILRLNDRFPSAAGEALVTRASAN